MFIVEHGIEDLKTHLKIQPITPLSVLRNSVITLNLNTFSNLNPYSQFQHLFSTSIPILNLNPLFQPLHSFPTSTLIHNLNTNSQPQPLFSTSLLILNLRHLFSSSTLIRTQPQHTFIISTLILNLYTHSQYQHLFTTTTLILNHNPHLHRQRESSLSTSALYIQTTNPVLKIDSNDASQIVYM